MFARTFWHNYGSIGIRVLSFYAYDMHIMGRVGDTPVFLNSFTWQK